MDKANVTRIPKEGRPYDATFVSEYGMFEVKRTFKAHNVLVVIKTILRMFGPKSKINKIEPVKQDWDKRKWDK